MTKENAGAKTPTPRFNLVEFCEERIDELAGKMRRGQLALETLEVYRMHDLPCPDEALETIVGCCTEFRDGAPDSGFTRADTVWKQPAARSLGEAFGIANVKGQHGIKRRRKAIMAPVLACLFDTLNPRSDAGRAAVADLLGLTEKQVKDWTPKR